MQPDETDSQVTDQGPADIDAKLESTNLAKKLSKEKLIEIGDKCKRGLEVDLDSRSDWETDLRDWIDLAKQIRQDKSYPWPNASNVKYPLLSTAAMQFAARSYPSLVPSNGKVVSSIVIGKDADGQKLEKAQRVSTYMSYQLLYEMVGWEEDMDKLLMMLPIVGTMFKKTFYDRSQDKIVSKLVMPTDLVVNYWARSLEDCERISEIIPMSRRVLKERQNKGIYLDEDLGDPPMPENSPNSAPGIDDTTPYELVEQHTFLDLKDTGYALPYIVTFERTKGTVLRIQNRFRYDDVETDDKGKILAVKPIQAYTKFGFVPNPDGSFYDIGFGVLLGPLNESVNTIINQLLDAGHLSTLQAGFIGKGLRLKSGDSQFEPGEWKPVNATGDDLRKQIVPLPTKEPSKVLFELMGTLITSGKELASVAEIFVGKMPGQNTPATTTMASIEQGMKVFTAVYKRIYRSLATEFGKIFDLNAIYLDPNKYIEVIDTEIGPDDFSRDAYDIRPGADPTAISQTEKLVKVQGLMEMLQLVGPMGILDPIEIVRRALDAQEQPNPEKLFSMAVQQTGAAPPPPPDPKLMAIQMKAQSDQQKTAMDLQAKQQEMELDGREKMMQMQMKQQEHAQKMQQVQEEAQVKAASQVQMARIFSATEQMKGQQQLQQADQQHQQKMTQEKEKIKLARSKPTPNKKN